MKIKFIKSTWGMTETSLRASLERIKNGGFDGVEMCAPDNVQEQHELKQLLIDFDLDYIGQQWTIGNSVKEHIESFKRQFDANAALNPIHINSHTGKDWYSIEQNVEIYSAANAYAQEVGVCLVHETHRGRATFSSNSLMALLDQVPEIRICADFSHWCCVHESFLEDQADRVERAIQHADYFHARVGHTQSAQVNDPRTPEWKQALEVHLAWWDRIIEVKKQNGRDELYCCPEFGPYPYMPEFPVSRKPLADLWEINHWMFQFLKERYKNG